MDFSEGIPPESRTLVVVPTMLTSAQNVEDLIEALEVRFLANRDDNLHFGLLTDFRDARGGNNAGGRTAVAAGAAKNRRLESEVPGATQATLSSFSIARADGIPRERIWMGYERKRGKLAELNSLLRGGGPGMRFSLVVGDTAVFRNVKYVITLDTDTQLPRDSARQFVGTMAHPLNRARYDEDKQRVCEGYGILQPRVA